MIKGWLITVIKTLTVISALLPISALAWNEPTDFKGIKFGEDPRSLIKECPIDTRFSTSSKIYRWYDTKEMCWVDEGYKDKDRLTVRNATIGDVYTAAEFQSMNGGLARIQLTFNSGNFLQLLTIFKQRYGMPTSSETIDWKSRAGATFKNNTAKWAGGNVSITMEERWVKVDEGVIIYETAEWKARSSKRIEESIKKGVKDL